MASSSSSPCAACKFLRRKCQPECMFAPYFPPDQPQKFGNVHKVFGASNVAKLLNELHPHQREDAVNSLAYEADMRLRDPIYGCVGVISLLQHQLRQLQLDLTCAKSELSRYQGFGITTGHGLIAAATATAAAANIQNMHHHHHHHQMFGRDHHQQQMINGNNCDAGLLAMNISAASIGQPLNHQFHQPSAAAGNDHPTIDPP